MKKDKVLVLGKGFLGQAFEKKGFEVWGKDKFEVGYDRWAGLADLGNYDVIINCMGKSDTRWCEKDENWEEVFLANGETPKRLSRFLGAMKKKFVHISTGCLYDRNDILQKEEDFIIPHCDYTVSKRVGEKNCNLEKDLILRPRLYFGDFENRNNLLGKLPRFDVFSTELNSYTSVHTIVDAVEALLDANQSGIFNVACEGNSSAMEIGKWIGLEEKPPITGKELREREGLYLVDNIVDISKLKEFYQPPKLKDEILRCWRALE